MEQRRSHKKAFIVVFEGNSGAGKETQFILAQQKARQQGLKVACFDFPRYGEASARPIEAYLRGEKAYTPYDAAVLYANDRLAVRDLLQEALAANDLLLINRYVPSNLAYQGASATNPDEQANLIRNIEKLEYEKNKLPRPDLTLFLAVDPRVAQQQVDKKIVRPYVDGRDLHESNLNLEIRAAQIYHALCETRNDFQEISCMKDEETLQSQGDIQDEIWNIITVKRLDGTHKEE